jgi:membrane protein YqaA with SNARE-associated domain
MTVSFESLFPLFLSPGGLVALAALDSSMLFFLPLAVDAAVVILSARSHDLFWVYPLLAAPGSLVGGAVTFWVGQRIGEKSLENWVSKRRLERVRQTIKNRGAVALAIPAILPPPFPLTPIILGCGALGVNRTRFLVTFAGMRLVRYGILSVLGWLYGRRILAVLGSESFKGLVILFTAVAVIGTAYTAYRVIKNTRGRRGQSSCELAVKNAASESTS